MNQELTQKLVKRFPVLYQGFYDPMSETCMCWGFDCGDGWFDIVWQLSLAIEDEIGYTKTHERWLLFKKRFWKRWNAMIYKSSPVRRDVTKTVKGDDNVWRQVVVEKAKPTWDERISRTLFGEERKIGVFRVPRSGLKRLIHHPNTGFSVMQVKEKFGGLRYYSPGNDRIFRLISLAERAADSTCEDCGGFGKLYTNGWMRTMCEKHAREDGRLNEEPTGTAVGTVGTDDAVPTCETRGEEPAPPSSGA